jgi:hypothetical protein
VNDDPDEALEGLEGLEGPATSTLLPPTLTPFADDVAALPARPSLLALGSLLGIGVLIDLWLQTSVAGVAALVAAGATAALLLVGSVRTTSGRALVLVALLPAAYLAVRASPWVVAIDVVAVILLFVLGGALGRDGRLFDLRFAALGRAVALAPVVAVTTPPPIVLLPSALRLPRSDHARRAAVARGTLLTVPLALLLALVLASGDAVFASLFSVSVDPGGMVGHVAAIVFGSWMAAGLLAQGQRGDLAVSRRPPFQLGAIEGMLVLAGLIVVYGLFAVARLLVVLRGPEYVVETTGLTYAEYARSGFFQLLWAAALTLLVLVGLRACVQLSSISQRRLFALLSLVAVALTLVMVHSAVVRLDLYADAFGLTMLRLCCTIFAWWLASVFVLTGLSLAGVSRTRSWLPGALLVSAVLTLLVFNTIDPEALVVERNVERAVPASDDDRLGEDEVDLEYLTSLSDDAVPTLVASLPDLSDEEQRFVLGRICRPSQGRSDDWTLASRRAADARAKVC